MRRGGGGILHIDARHAEIARRVDDGLVFECREFSVKRRELCGSVGRRILTHEAELDRVAESLP